MRTSDNYAIELFQVNHLAARTPSRVVRPPRVAASTCALERNVTQILSLTDLDGKAVDRRLVMGDDYIIDVLRIKPIARCGYMDHTAIESFFSMKRPAGAGRAGKLCCADRQCSEATTANFTPNARMTALIVAYRGCAPGLSAL